MTDIARGAIEDTIPQLIQKLDDSNLDVRRAVMDGIVQLAKNGV
jgi:hypothetical protein